MTFATFLSNVRKKNMYGNIFSVMLTIHILRERTSVPAAQRRVRSTFLDLHTLMNSA